MMTIPRSLIVACLCALGSDALAGTPASQQDPPSASSTPTTTAAAARKDGRGPASLPFLIGDGTAVQFEFEAAKDKKTGTARFEVKGWALSLTGPLDEETSDIQPLSLQGLLPGSSASLTYTRLFSPRISEMEKLKAQELCEEEFARQRRESRPRRDGATSAPPCNDKAFKNEKDALSFLGLLHAYDALWTVGGTFGVSRSRFKYLERDGLDAGDESHQGVSATARIGRVSAATGFVVASFTYKQFHKAAGAPVDVCQPLGSTGADTCKPAVIGSPTQVTLKVGALELRRRLTSTTAWAPSVRYDFTTKVSTIDLPIYAMGNKSSVLGGVRFGWRSDTKDLSVLMFFGGTFDLIARD